MCQTHIMICQHYHNKTSMTNDVHINRSLIEQGKQSMSEIMNYRCYNILLKIENMKQNLYRLITLIPSGKVKLSNSKKYISFLIVYFEDFRYL